MFSKLRVSQASTLFAKSNADKCNAEPAEAAAKSVAATEAAAIAELQAAKDGKVSVAYMKCEKCVKSAMCVKCV